MLYLSKFLLITTVSFKEAHPSPLLCSPPSSTVCRMGSPPLCWAQGKSMSHLIRKMWLCLSLPWKIMAGQTDWHMWVYVWLRCCVQILVYLHLQGPYPTEDAVDADLINAGECYPNQDLTIMHCCEKLKEHSVYLFMDEMQPISFKYDIQYRDINQRPCSAIYCMVH